MRIVAVANVKAYAVRHPETVSSFATWERVIKGLSCRDMTELQSYFPKASALNGERIRFEIAGGNYRLIASIAFKSQTLYVKLIGTHGEYDRVDALTVSQF